MTPRKETTIECMYREVNGHKMPPSIKRILLPNRRRNREAETQEHPHDERIQSALLDELRKIRRLLG
jgi:hypothetical protein